LRFASQKGMSMSPRIAVGFLLAVLGFGCERTPYKYQGEGRLFSSWTSEEARGTALASVIQLDFEEPGDLSSVQIVNIDGEGRISDQCLRFSSEAKLPYLVIPFQRDASEANLVTIRFRAKVASSVFVSKLYWTTPECPNGKEELSVQAVHQRSEGFVTARFCPGTNPNWSGPVPVLRFDPALEPGEFEIDYVKVQKVPFEALHVKGKENRLPLAEMAIRHETRPSTVFPSPEKLSAVVRLPKEARLRFAVGVLPERWRHAEGSVRAEIRVRSGLRETSVYSEEIRTAGTEGDAPWVEDTVDLSSFAGRRVRLDFLIHSEQGDPCACWSCPRILSSGRERDTDRPHVILVSLDAVRADRLGCYGHTEAKTPWLDSLASRGVFFENCVSSSSWTLPSHMSLLCALDTDQPTQTLWCPPSETPGTTLWGSPTATWFPPGTASREDSTCIGSRRHEPMSDVQPSGCLGPSTRRNATWRNTRTNRFFFFFTPMKPTITTCSIGSPKQLRRR